MVLVALRHIIPPTYRECIAVSGNIAIIVAKQQGLQIGKIIDNLANS